MTKQKKSRLITIGIFIVLFAVIVAVDVIFFNSNYEEYHSFKMDTNITIKGDGEDIDLAARDILKAIDEIDVNMNASNVKGNLYKLNRLKTADVSDDTIYVLKIADDVRKKSNGAFNVLIKPLVDLWGFGGEFQKVPDTDSINKTLENIKNSSYTIEKNTVTLQNGEIDLGGIAKGFSSDKSREILEKYNVNYAVLDFGGNIATYGKKPDNEPFKIGISNGSGGIFATVSVGETCIVTSGGYERYFEENGKKYHHILNPETGYPEENGLVSVTVITENGTLADALSTACFVSGKEKGIKLAKEYGVNAIFLEESQKATTVGKVNFADVAEGYKVSAAD